MIRGLNTKLQGIFSKLLSANTADGDGFDKKKMIMVAVVGLVLLYSDYNFIIKRQFEYIRTTGPKIVQLKTDMVNLTRELATMKDLVAKRQMLEREGKLRLKKMIAEEEIPALLQFISDAANKNEISVMQMRPSRQVALKANKAPAGAAKYTPVSIVLNLSGTYHNIGKFINDLENAEDFISVEEIKISPDSGTEFKQVAYLSLKTYAEK